MPATTSKMLQSSDKAYEKAWDEQPKKFEPCKDCKAASYCKANGCQAKESAALKKLEG